MIRYSIISFCVPYDDSGMGTTSVSFATFFTAALPNTAHDEEKISFVPGFFARMVSSRPRTLSKFTLRPSSRLASEPLDMMPWRM